MYQKSRLQTKIAFQFWDENVHIEVKEDWDVCLIAKDHNSAYSETNDWNDVWKKNFLPIRCANLVLKYVGIHWVERADGRHDDMMVLVLVLVDGSGGRGDRQVREGFPYEVQWQADAHTVDAVEKVGRGVRSRCFRTFPSIFFSACRYIPSCEFTFNFPCIKKIFQRWIKTVATRSGVSILSDVCSVQVKCSSN